jgi:phage gp36-like protein
MGDIEDARRRYEDARRLLEHLAKGVVALGLPADLPGPEQPQLSLAAASVGSPRVMGRDATGGY